MKIFFGVLEKMDEYILDILANSQTFCEIPRNFRVRPLIPYISDKFYVPDLPKTLLEKYFTPEVFYMNTERFQAVCLEILVFISNMLECGNIFMAKLIIKRFAGNLPLRFQTMNKTYRRHGYLLYGEKYWHCAIEDSVYYENFEFDGVYFVLKM